MTCRSEYASRLLERIASREARVGVIGMGYVGLPLALTFAEAGFAVLGFDIDEDKVRSLEAGRSYIRHIDASRLSGVLAADRFRATADFDRLGEMDAVLVCVPTPLGESRRPDLRYVEATAAAIAPRLRAGQLIVLESTTYPGTTEEVVQPILRGPEGGSAELDFFLAYSPERENPGDPDHTTRSIPKVVGGLDELACDVAEGLYGAVVERVVRVSSTRVAEATKLTENVFRAVNIALVNELKVICEALGLDIWEVLDAAASKPFGFMRFSPGPGLGGHCIPIDPFYLAWSARQAGVEARFIELAGEVNTAMPGRVVARLSEELAERGTSLRGSRILVLGLAYKPNVDDPRESPAFEILARLGRAGARAAYHDPYIARAPAMRSWAELPPLESVDLTPAEVAAYDAVVVVTDHAVIDWELVAAHARLIIDTRGVYRPAGANVVRA